MVMNLLILFIVCFWSLKLNESVKFVSNVKNEIHLVNDNGHQHNVHSTV